MLASLKTMLPVASLVAGAAVLCPLCDVGTQTAAGQSAPRVAPSPDTVTVRLHISGMTCGTCPATARAALRKLPGVISAEVTLDDSLGVVRYDPRQVTPAQIAAHLTRLTGYGAKVLADDAKKRRGSAA